MLAQRQKEADLNAQIAEGRKAQERLAELEAANLSAEEKAAQERENDRKAAAEGREALRQGRLLAALAKSEHQIVDAEAAAALITGVEYDETGTPTNLADRVEALLTERAFLKRPDTTTSPAKAPNLNGGSGTGGAAPPSLTAEQIEFAAKIGKTPEQYAAWLDAKSPEDAAKIAQAAVKT